MNASHAMSAPLAMRTSNHLYVTRQMTRVQRPRSKAMDLLHEALARARCARRPNGETRPAREVAVTAAWRRTQRGARGESV